MTRYAVPLLVFGVITLLFGVGMAVYAGPNVAPNLPEPNLTLCQTCHESAHVQAMPVADQLTAGPAATTAEPTLSCSDCHSEQLTPAANYDSVSEAQRMRLAAVQAQLDTVMTEHPEWEHYRPLSQKPAEQIMAERVYALVAFVEADANWGFHQPTYTEAQLLKAERLMGELQAALATESDAF